MNKIEEYLNTLDKKNLIMLYISIFIVGFVVYYNFNYSILIPQIEKNKSIINKLKFKLATFKTKNTKIIKLKKELKLLKEQNYDVSQDLKYLNTFINTTPFLKLDDKKFLTVLNNILLNAIDQNIYASYSISSDNGDFIKKKIQITGKFDYRNFREFYNFYQSIEKIKAIKTEPVLKLTYNNGSVDFIIEFILWGVK